MKVYESPPFCPVYYQGEHILQLYGLYTMYTGIRVDSGTLLSAANPKKRHFSHFSLSPGAGIIILQPPKAAFCEGGTMAHQNLKRKWGVTMLLSELPRLELAKRGKNGIFGTNSNNYTHNIPRHPLGWTWNLKLTPLPIFLTNKIKTFLRKIDSSEEKLESAEKLAQVKTILTWWTKTISPKFWEFCATFRISWKWVETTKTTCFTHFAGGISSHLMPLYTPKMTPNRHFWTFTRNLCI